MSGERIPDGLLLRRYREGDESAFTELVRRHGRLVHATCRRETGDAGLAEDAAQGVFLLLSRRNFGDESSLAGWLHQAARHVSRSLVRGEIRRRRRERRAVEEYAEPEAAWDAISPQIDAALAALRPGDREAVLLRFTAEMSLAEVGSALGIGENAARMRVSRALEKLRQHLRRAGVGVGVVLLSALLSTRFADANPIVYSHPSARVVRAADRVFLPGGIGWIPASIAAATAVCVALLVGTWWMRMPKRADATEVQSLFGSTVGPWKGTLEFADDASGERTKADVNVRVVSGESTFTLTSTYPNYARVDTTTFSIQGDPGIRIENGGPEASHRLDGVYVPYRREGGLEFVGWSDALQAQVRLQLTVSANRLELSEEYRRDEGEFRFRNRFSLSR